MGIANHCSGIETPSLMMETASILVRLNVEDATFRHILPTLQFDKVSLPSWREALHHTAHGPAHFSKIVRGEAYVAIRGLAIPWLSGSDPPSRIGDIPDPDAFLDAMARGFLHAADEIDHASVEDLWQGGKPLLPPTPSQLSPGATEAYGTFHVGLRSWSKGWARAASIHTRAEAALAILTDSEMPAEPITGLPFVYDPEFSTLAHPDDPRLDEIGSDPIIVPSR